MTTTRLPDDPVITQDVTLDDRQRQILDAAEAAMGQIRQSFEQWLLVGRAFQELQLEAIHRSNSNDASGRRYSDWHEVLLAKFIKTRPHLATVSPSMRSRAIWMVENEAAVSEWRDGLTESQRLNWNNPSTVRRHFMAPETAAPGPLPDEIDAAALLAEHFAPDDDDLPESTERAGPYRKKQRSPVDVKAMTETIAHQADEIVHLIEEIERLQKRIRELEAALLVEGATK